MPSDASFMQYLRAHGNTPGPTLRPYTTGAISSLIAVIPYLVIMAWSGALAAATANLHLDIWFVVSVAVALMVLAGLVYAVVFKRAANDRQGGWLFGISYGFAVW